MPPLSAAAVNRLMSQQELVESLDLPPPPPPLKPVPIIHTTAYLQQTQQLVVPDLPTTSQEQEQQQYDLQSNAIVWALQKVDNQLNQVEQQPSEIHQAIYNFSNGPVGQATSKGVQVAAKVTMTATIEAAKVAAPVGKWALQQGFKAAVGLVGAAMQQERQREQQKQQQQQGNGKGASSSKATKRR